jgi:putative ABC transport system permease protein
VAGVEQVAATAVVTGATVRRSPYVDEAETGGISVAAADPSLPAAVGATLAHGRFLNAATGATRRSCSAPNAARRSASTTPARACGSPGAGSPSSGSSTPVTLAPELDDAALIGFDVAERLLDADRNASTIYVRADPDTIAARARPARRHREPGAPEEVDVSRPSDALEARAAAKTAFTSLFLGLGAVALLVGGVGIANVMVISVLERRSEVGLRRALGRPGGHVGAQFLCESVLLAAAGGLAGVLLGASVTAGYAQSQGWSVVVPAVAVGGGVAAALAIGALAGSYPALRAARLAPTDALRTV